MDLVIPRILTGPQTGVGSEIKQTGREIARAGVNISAVIDGIQKNIDYNSAIEIKNQSELERQKYSQEFWIKEDGSDSAAVERFQVGLQEIDKKHSESAYKINDRVGGFVDKYNQVRTAELTQAGQQTYYKKMLAHSQKLDMAETDLMTKQAISSGEINFTMQERGRALEQRRSIYGNNVEGIKREHNAYMVENFIRGRLANPATAPAMVQALNDPSYKANLFQHIPAEKVDEMERVLASASSADRKQQGRNIGVEIFKADQTGKLEAMTDAVRERKLPGEAEEWAISQIKELYAERKNDIKANREAVVDKYTGILAGVALKRNGLNRISDLTPAQWQEFTEADPALAGRTLDTMRREADFQARENKRDRRDAEREKKERQGENESSIMISDDFATRDLRRDLAAGDISTTQYTKLLKAQKDLDPIKRDSVKNALSKVNSGSALAKALNVTDKSAEAQWKLKYGDLVKAWAYNHADDPNFDANMTEFVEKQILSKMATSFFASDETDRQEKFTKAKGEAGDLPLRGKKPDAQKYSQEDLEFTAKKHGITVDEVKRRLEVK